MIPSDQLPAVCARRLFSDAHVVRSDLKTIAGRIIPLIDERHTPQNRAIRSGVMPQQSAAAFVRIIARAVRLNLFEELLLQYQHRDPILRVPRSRNVRSDNARPSRGKS